ncbi:hypothetical protein Plhal304r1_c029g0095411 [Plasmopara halstedii]
MIAPQCRTLSLISAFALLTTTETATAETTAEADVPILHRKTHTPSKSENIRNSIEDRVFLTPVLAGAAEHSMTSLADSRFTNENIDQLRQMKFLDSTDVIHENDDDAIESLIAQAENVDDLFRSKHVLAWFGNKSPENQKLAINRLLNKLKNHKRTQQRLNEIFATGKTGESLSHYLSIAVERKWWASLSAQEIKNALRFSIETENNEEFVRFVGEVFWMKFEYSGEEDFKKVMLTLMRNRSDNEFMWAGISYKVMQDKDWDWGISLSGVFDDLLLTYDKAAGDYTPSQAVEFLAKHESTVAIKFGMTSIETENDKIEYLLNELLTISQSELMWAKVLVLLHDEENTSESSGVLRYLIESWMKKFSDIGVNANKIGFSPSYVMLTNEGFIKFCLFAQFMHNDFDEYLLRILLQLSNGGTISTHALYTVQKDATVYTGMHDTLLHYWNQKQYDTTAAAKDNHIFVVALNDVIERALAHSFSPTSIEAEATVTKLLEYSKNEAMWARFLDKLQEYTTIRGFVPKVFDVLIGKHNTEATADESTPSECFVFLKSDDFEKLFFEVEAQSNGNVYGKMLA